MSLVDELLADLDAAEEDGNASEMPCETAKWNQDRRIAEGISLKMIDPMEQEREFYSLQHIAKLHNGIRLKEAMENIQKCLSKKQS